MRKIIWVIIGVLFACFCIGIISAIAFCARGGEGSYKNYFDIVQYEDEYYIYANVKNEEPPNTLAVKSVLFECKIKNSDGKKDSFTFLVKTIGEDGLPATIGDENHIIIKLTREDIADYMQVENIKGSITSYEIKDVAFTHYHIESDNFAVWLFTFNPLAN